MLNIQRFLNNRIIIACTVLFMSPCCCHGDADSADGGDQNILGDANSNSTVVFAQVAFRNGLHAVQHGESYNLSYHEEDVTDLRLKGDLTKRGKNMVYMIGKYLKERYANLFNNSYDQYKVRMFSGTTNRTIVTAALFAAGMFPPQQDYEIWNENLRWQPVPIHINTKLTDTDAINIALAGACENLNWITEDEPYDTLKKNNKWIIDFLCDMVNESSDVFTATAVSSNLINLNEYPGSEPEWANQTVMELAKNYYWDVMGIVITYHAVVRLSGGWILEDMINEMKYYMSRGGNRKFVGYSLHVDNQNSLLISLNNQSYPRQWPPMGGFMSLELHYIELQYVVKAFYWYTSYTDPIEVNITNCEEPCTLEKFEARSRDYHVDNWAVECGQLVNVNSTAGEDPKEDKEEQYNSTDTTSTMISSGNCSLSTAAAVSNSVLLALCILFGLLFLLTLILLFRARRKLGHKGDYIEIR